MSSVYKRGRRWYAQVKDAEGKWRQFATTATNKRQAKHLADELEEQFALERLERGADESIAPAQSPSGHPKMALSVGEVLVWYLETYLLGKSSYANTKAAIRRHIAPSLGNLPLSELTAGHVERLLQRKASEGYAPQTLNHLRGYIARAINKAIRAGKWNGANVASVVESRRVPRKVYDWLRVEEVPLLIEALDARFRPYFATALYTAMRKGELAGLRKSDVDLKGRLLFVRRSYDRETTKGGHADVIPIAPALVPWLELAIEASPSELVFPGPSGEMLRRDFKASAIFQRALSRAGIVTGYEHVCRRRGCGHKEVREDSAQRRCPSDGRMLWPKAIPRPLRFHDLRGTCASLLLQGGVQLELVAAILRHSDPKLTLERYAHMSPEFLAAAVARMDFGLPPTPPSPTPAEAEAAVAGTTEFTADLLQTGGFQKKSPGTQKATCVTSKNPGAFLERAMGFEPTTLSLGSRSGRVQQDPMRPETSVSVGEIPRQNCPTFQRVSNRPTKSTASLLQRSRMKLITGHRDNLLSVRQVASQLGVSPATVYKLITRNELPHLRVSNAIRIRPADLKTFMTPNSEGGES